MAGDLAKVVVIVGPTASGKTALSLSLAKEFNGEIISADSRQIYQEMDIGTAKATKIELNGMKHYLIDIKKPDADYSAGQFKKDALQAIRQILKQKKLPIVVGGTGLYISTLVNNLNIPEAKEDKKLRTKLEKEIEEKGLGQVFKKLVELDPEAAYVVDPKNRRRVVRALEVALLTGQTFTSQRKKGEPLFDFVQIGIRGTPETLKRKIEERAHRMYGDGLIEEVRKLIAKYGRKPKAFEAIGYREIIDYLDGKITLEESRAQMIKNTWQYARRQLSWFNKDKKVKWVNNKKEAMGLASKFLKA